MYVFGVRVKHKPASTPCDSRPPGTAGVGRQHKPYCRQQIPFARTGLTVCIASARPGQQGPAPCTRYRSF